MAMMATTIITNPNPLPIVGACSLRIWNPSDLWLMFVISEFCVGDLVPSLPSPRLSMTILPRCCVRCCTSAGLELTGGACPQGQFDPWGMTIGGAIDIFAGVGLAGYVDCLAFWRNLFDLIYSSFPYSVLIMYDLTSGLIAVITAGLSHLLLMWSCISTFSPKWYIVAGLVPLFA